MTTTVLRHMRNAIQPSPWGGLCTLFAVCDLLLTRPPLIAGWLWIGQWLFTHLVVVFALPVYAHIIPVMARKLAIFGTAFFCAQTLSHVLWLIAFLGPSTPRILPHIWP